MEITATVDDAQRQFRLRWAERGGPPVRPPSRRSFGSRLIEHSFVSQLLPAGFVPPCLPMKARKPPSGALWLHEIKHDGFRVIARKDGPRVKLYSRPGNDLTDRFSLIVEALAGLRSRSCIIDGEAVACDERGIAAFDLIRYRRNDGCVFLYASI